MKEFSTLPLARLVTASAAYRVLVIDVTTSVGMLPAGRKPLGISEAAIRAATINHFRI